jgi:hypothetical protein
MTIHILVEMRMPKKNQISQEAAVFHSSKRSGAVDLAEEVCDCGDDDLLLLDGELGKDG